MAVGELADGLKIDLDAVPKKYQGLDGTELRPYPSLRSGWPCYCPRGMWLILSGLPIPKTWRPPPSRW